MEENRKKTILLVDDEEDLLKVLSKILSNAGYHVHVAIDGVDALAKVKQFIPDLMVLDVMMPGMDGKQLKAHLNEDETLADIPVIFLSARDTTEDKVEALRLMADDYMTKPFDAKELLARIERALERHEYYRNLSMTDGLTSLPNIHAYKKEIEVVFNITSRYRRVFSIAVVDVDNLKAINDTFGHKAGDRAIQTVAKAACQTARKADRVIRYGGDEFVVILPETTAEQATVAMRRFKESLANTEFYPQDSGPAVTISVSVGVATYFEGVKNPAELFELADKAMYKEKIAKKKSL